MKTLKIEDETHRKLSLLKAERGYTSFDELINSFF